MPHFELKKIGSHTIPLNQIGGDVDKQRVTFETWSKSIIDGDIEQYVVVRDKSEEYVPIEISGSTVTIEL